MRYHLPFLSLAVAILKSCVFSLHKVRFHHSSCLHSNTPVCDGLRPVVAGSNLARSLTAFSFPAEQASHFCPCSNRANGLIFFSQLLHSSQVKTWQLMQLTSLCIFRLDKMSLKNLYVFLNIATNFSFCCWALKCNSSKSEFKTIKDLQEKQMVGWLCFLMVWGFFPFGGGFERTRDAGLYCSA